MASTSSRKRRFEEDKKEEKKEEKSTRSAQQQYINNRSAQQNRNGWPAQQWICKPNLNSKQSGKCEEFQYSKVSNFSDPFNSEEKKERKIFESFKDCEKHCQSLYLPEEVLSKIYGNLLIKELKNVKSTSRNMIDEKTKIDTDDLKIYYILLDIIEEKSSDVNQVDINNKLLAKDEICKMIKDGRGRYTFEEAITASIFHSFFQTGAVYLYFPIFVCLLQNEWLINDILTLNLFLKIYQASIHFIKQENILALLRLGLIRPSNQVSTALITKVLVFPFPTRPHVLDYLLLDQDNNGKKVPKNQAKSQLSLSILWSFQSPNPGDTYIDPDVNNFFNNNTTHNGTSVTDADKIIFILEMNLKMWKDLVDMDLLLDYGNNHYGTNKLDSKMIIDRLDLERPGLLVPEEKFAILQNGIGEQTVLDSLHLFYIQTRRSKLWLPKLSTTTTDSKEKEVRIDELYAELLTVLLSQPYFFTPESKNDLERNRKLLKKFNQIKTFEKV
jgi:hypothetical protein